MRLYLDDDRDANVLISFLAKTLAVDKENRLVLRLMGTLERLDTASGAWYIQQQYWRTNFFRVDRWRAE